MSDRLGRPLWTDGPAIGLSGTKQQQIRLVPESNCSSELPTLLITTEIAMNQSMKRVNKAYRNGLYAKGDYYAAKSLARWRRNTMNALDLMVKWLKVT